MQFIYVWMYVCVLISYMVYAIIYIFYIEYIWNEQTCKYINITSMFVHFTYEYIYMMNIIYIFIYHACMKWTCKHILQSKWQLISTNSKGMKRQTLSDSHSRVQVLIASTHRFGFMSFGQIPAWEYATLCKLMPFTHCLSTNSSRNCPETNQIQRGNSIHHMSEGRNEELSRGVY